MRTLPFVRGAIFNSCRDEGRRIFVGACRLLTTWLPRRAWSQQYCEGRSLWGPMLRLPLVLRGREHCQSLSFVISQRVFTFSGEGTWVLVQSLLWSDIREHPGLRYMHPLYSDYGWSPLMSMLPHWQLQFSAMLQQKLGQGRAKESVCVPLAYFAIRFIQGQQRAVIRMKCTRGRVWAGDSVWCGTCAPPQLALLRGRDTANAPRWTHWQQVIELPK